MNKDKITTICGLVVAISGTILSLQPMGIAIPQGVITAALVAGAIGTAVIGYFTGKTPDGKSL